MRWSGVSAFMVRAVRQDARSLPALFLRLAVVGFLGWLLIIFALAAAGWLVTVIALSYAGLLEGSVLTETVFAWPGLGLYITNSLQNADMNAVLGGTLVVGTVFIGLNLFSDALYRWLDPRTKER